MELIKLLQIEGISEATQEDIIFNFLECIDEESALSIVEEYEQAEMSLTESIINEVSLGYALKKSLGGAVQRFNDIRKKQANVSTDRPIGLAGIRRQEAQRQDVAKAQERFKQAKSTAKDVVNKMFNTRYVRDNKVATRTPQGTNNTTTPQGTNNTTTPQGKNTTTQGKNTTTPQGTNNNTPQGKNTTTPQGKNTTTPQGTNNNTPQGTNNNTTSQGKNTTTPQGNNNVFKRVTSKAKQIVNKILNAKNNNASQGNNNVFKRVTSKAKQIVNNILNAKNNNASQGTNNTTQGNNAKVADVVANNISNMKRDPQPPTSTVQPTGNEGEKPNENNGEKPNENNGEKPNENNGEKPNENNGEKPNENNGEKPNENNGEKPKKMILQDIIKRYEDLIRKENKSQADYKQMEMLENKYYNLLS